MRNDQIAIVCGHGRCGSSMVCQMLAAAGLPVAGEHPLYEPIEGAPGHGIAWVEQYRGGAIKFLDPYRYPPPRPPRGVVYKPIWLDRDPKEQSRSFIKFQRQRLGAKMNRADLGRVRRAIKKGRGDSLRELRRYSKQILMLRFEDVLADPKNAAGMIGTYLGGRMATNRMASVVRPRSPECLIGFLEDTLHAGKCVV